MRVICGVLRLRAELSITSPSLLHHSELVLAVSPRCPRALYSLLELPLLPLPLQSLSWDRSWGLGLGYGGPVLPSLPDSAFGDPLCLFNPSWFLLRAGSTAGLRHGFPRAPQGMRMLCKPPPEPGFAVCALSPGKVLVPTPCPLPSLLDHPLVSAAKPRHRQDPRDGLGDITFGG